MKSTPFWPSSEWAASLDNVAEPPAGVMRIVLMKARGKEEQRGELQGECRPWYFVVVGTGDNY
jgi:hypothetical protein